MRVLFVAALVTALVWPWPAAAQRQSQRPGEKPKAPIVQSLGCAEQRTGSPVTWWLVRASSADAAPPGPFHISQVEKAKGAALGTNAFRLIGETDFLSVEELLKSGERSRFTTPDTANASGQLRAGRKVLVKGLLVVPGDVGGEQRINLMSVVSLADSCG